MAHKRRHKLFFFILTPVAGLFVFLFFSHLILNRPVFQRWILESTNKILSIDLSWDELKFNALTGHFEGKNLTLLLPKSHSTIRLKNFRLGLDPLRLLFKKVHLFNLEADFLSISIEARSEEKKEIPKSFYRFLNRLTIDHAEIREVILVTPDSAHLHIGRFTLHSQLAFFLLKRGINFDLTDFDYRSPKGDLFLDELKGTGSLNFSLDKQLDNYLPEWNGNLNWHNLLFGFRKTPNPWNLSPAWDSSLTPIIQRYYTDNIPDDRAFGFMDSGKLDIKFQLNDIELTAIQLNAFGGRLNITGKWDRHNHDFAIDIKNPVPIRMALLPLGKAQIRQAFENLDLTLSAKGKLTDLLHGNINGVLQLQATGNHVTNIQEPLTILGNIFFKDGMVGINDLKGTFDTGEVTGKGEINLDKKTVSSSFSTKTIDAQTIVHFFAKINVPGKADCDGTIQGALNNPVFNISLSSPLAGYESLTFGVFKGNLSIRDKRLSITGSTLLEGGGIGNLDLHVDDVFSSATQMLTLKTEFKNLDAGPLLRLTALTGHVNGFFNLEGPTQKLLGKGHITATDIDWYGIPVSKIEGDLNVDNKELSIHPAQILFDAKSPPIVVSKPFIFNFGPEGYHFSGTLLPSVSAEGERKISDPDFLTFKLKADKTSLDFLSPVLWVGIDHFLVSGTFDGKYQFSSPKDSIIHSEITAFDFKGEEKKINLIGKTTLDYEGEKINFHHSTLQAGEEKITLDGPISFSDGSHLSIKGGLDCYQMAGLVDWLVDGNGLANLDLVMTGSPKTPLFEGKVDFKNASLNFRGMKHELNETNGTLKIKGNRFQFEHIQTNYDDAPASVNGWIEWTAPKVTSADLTLQGREVPMSSDAWQALADVNLTIRGSGGSLRMSGDLQIVEGVYYKDYDVSQFILKPVGVVLPEEEDNLQKMFGDMNLDLQVRSSGDFEIRNNLANVALKGDLGIQGNVSHPQMTGTINVLEGNIHTLGINFEGASGFITFNNPRGVLEIKPYLEFSASRSIQQYEVHAKIKGVIDNLALSLESTPPLNHTDIISLIAYGVTPEELSSTKKNLFSTTAIASQVVSLLQRPLSRATHIDIVKLESENDAFTNFNALNPVSRFSIGKQLSTRFSLVFTTDLTLSQAEKGVTAEYLIFDNILLKGVKDTSSRYRFDLTLRFESY